MVKYKVIVPKPKAGKLKKSHMVVDVGGRITNYAFPDKSNMFEFEVPDGSEYIYANKTPDAVIFNVWIEYSNEERTETKKINLVPMQL